MLISASIAGAGASRVGRAREASNSAGESSSPGLGSAACLLRLDGDGDVAEVEDEVRFLATRLAAERICFASFSSAKTDWIFGRGALDRLSGLRGSFQHWFRWEAGWEIYVVRETSLRSLTLDMASGTGTLAS